MSNGSAVASNSVNQHYMGITLCNSLKEKKKKLWLKPISRFGLPKKCVRESICESKYLAEHHSMHYTKLFFHLIMYVV